jgi:hypothetical protein
MFGKVIIGYTGRACCSLNKLRKEQHTKDFDVLNKERLFRCKPQRELKNGQCKCMTRATQHGAWRARMTAYEGLPRPISSLLPFLASDGERPVTHDVHCFVAVNVRMH